MSYTPITPNTVSGNMPGGLTGSALDLPSFLSKTLAFALNQAWQFAVVGQPTSITQYQANLLSAAQAYIAAFPFALPAGATIAGIVNEYALIWLQQLEATPLDSSGRLAAGMVADHLGSIPEVNGVLNLSQFEPVAPPPVTTIDPNNAGAVQPPSMPYAAWGWIQTLVGARWVLLSLSAGAQPWYTAPYYSTPTAPAAPFSNAN